MLWTSMELVHQVTWDKGKSVDWVCTGASAARIVRTYLCITEHLVCKPARHQLGRPCHLGC